MGLISIKILKFSGNLIANLVLGLAGFFSWLLRRPFHKILAKIYYQLFRFRKNNLNQPGGGFLKESLVYFFIFIVTVLLLFNNITNNQPTGTLGTQIPKTVLANLVPTEFGDLPNEELVEEIATPSSLNAVSQEKYLNDSCSLQKQVDLTGQENPDQQDWLDFSSEGDLAFKPSLIGANGSMNNTAPIQRSEIVYYTIQAGDTISSVAQRFSISVNTILWANNLGARSVLRIGDRLAILPYSGVLYTVKKGDTLAKVAQKYNIEVDKILNCNNLGNTLAVGQKIIIPGAKLIPETVAVAKTSRNYTGISAIRDLIKSPKTQPASGAKMTWPTVGYRITQYFSWKHPGVDIANKIGTPVYAADSGVVEFAGWATGYGYSIVINHGNGIKTRYGHSSKLFVSVGDEVEKGENIMAMGSTGWSTGPHLHFEVMVNGKKYNPLNYIK